MMNTKLVLIRHGETDWTKNKRYCGSNDIPLNACGRKQARLLAKSFPVQGIDTVYSSDMKRCTALAKIVFKKKRVTLYPGLREMGFGVFEGLGHAALRKKYPGLYARWLKNFGSVTPPQGESFSTFRKRVRKAFREIVSKNKGKTCAVVTHGGVMMVMLSAIVGRSKIWKFLPSLASVSVIEISGRKMELKSFNDTSHL